MKGFLELTLLFACITVALSQYDSPTPPRLAIPAGAIPIPIRPQGRQYKNERLIQAPNVVKIRRPHLNRPQPVNAVPVQTPRTLIDEAKPVTEEYEEETNEPFVPQLISNPPPQVQQNTQALFSNDQNLFETNDEHETPRFQPQERPAPQRASERFVPIDVPQPVQRFNPNTQNQQLKPNQYRAQRPTYREPVPQRNQYQQEPEAIRQVPARVVDVRPRPHSTEERERKPVAQILRKYREENEDGTITWGFENDDGSYKEEVIGTDCVTRGRYGYIDPDGLKREYTYETGILCDPNNRDAGEDDEDEKGYVDYQENKAVLPSGIKIDLSQMGKNKSKRPAQLQQQQQNFYRN